MKRISILSIVLLILMTSCIENDIPYPRLVGEITAFAVEGQMGVSVIDTEQRTVSVTLSDSVDIKEVRVTQFEITDDAVIEPEITRVIDLSTPKKYVLTTYPGQNYEWTISAVQDLGLCFIVEGEADNAKIDPKQKSILIQMPLGTDLRYLNVLDYKLGPKGTTVEPDPKTVKDYSKTQKFTASYHGKEEFWSINAITIESVPLKITTEPADAYAKRAYLIASSNKGDSQVLFKYRKNSDTEWIEVPAENVQSEHKTHKALIEGLEPEMEYVYYAYCEDKSGEEVHFTTEAAAQLPNLNFDSWVKDGKIWYANSTSDPNSPEYFWDTANAGANILSFGDNEKNPTVPEYDLVAVPGENKAAAKMETVSVVGVLAAGNVYSGQYIETAGTNAILDWGRPFTSRPTALEGYYLYQPKVIDKAKDPYSDMKGQMDKCQIFVALMDFDGPYRVESSLKNYIDFAKDPAVIGFGELVTSDYMEKYEKFRIDIEYRDARKPTYIILIACASYYGNYFTGAVGTRLYADEFELIY